MTDDLKQKIQTKCREMGIPLFGIADVCRWEDPLLNRDMPEAFYPRSIWPETQSVIVIGLPVHLPALETSPSVWYREEYRTINSLLDQYTYRLAEFLNGQGYPSVSVPRDGYGHVSVLVDKPVSFFSHRHAAYLAGLGNFGVNNMLLTPQYGPRVRFGSILTAAPLPGDQVMEGQLCTRCMQCVEQCPVQALSEDDYPDGLTEKATCAGYSQTLEKHYLAPCGVCIKVCPVGEDRAHYHREDTGIYRNRAGAEGCHRAWEHVRRYGAR
ncbi:4Fe-4S binding protein [Methanogenium sp. MK-MG]|uniref:4Fe-4S binding protein n=1 Tax=Methanogenium sp. MK-MG TaxID=2599926 RepID=UPI0013ED0DDD|nr:4Fe-4S binding protein [Methanogenium sp. MK-MG]KAF1078147.1 Epoxyqueuosine reductase [Methanogenium sp. MK-MG]